MKARLITNPYIVYAAGFIIALLVYCLNWSELYPALTKGVLLFLIVSVLLSIIIGLLLHKTNYLSYKAIYFSPLKLWIVTILIIVSVLFECAYLHVIPIVAVLKGQSDFRYTDFGIQTFHVIVVTFNSFWATFVFHNYVSQKKKHLLLCYIFCLLPAVIIFSRSMILLNLTAAFFILFMSSKHVVKLLVKGAVIGICSLFLFGIAGNVRESQGASVNDLFLTIGKATPEFRKSSIPKEFFWSYIYISSPLATLQQTVNKHDVNLTPQKFGTFINVSFLPDFISKRITYFTKPEEKINRISNPFTVGTTYAFPFAYAGWIGIISMFLYIMFFNLATILILPKNSIFFITAIAVLNCIMLYSIFDNMIAYSGTSVQLFYPPFFYAVGKLISEIKKRSSFVNENTDLSPA